MQVYVEKIHEILAKMFAILPYIDPINKASANKYLETVYGGVYTLTASVNACYVSIALQVRHNSHAPIQPRS
jgi:hypothetical protein